MGLDVRPCGPGLSGAAAPLDAWDDAPLLRLAAPVLCVAWEAAMFARVVFAGADPSLSAPSSQAALFVLMAVGCAALFLRYRLPVVSVLFESVVGLLASAMGALAYVYFLPLVALYACVARAPRREAAAGGVAAVATVALSAVVDGFAGASASSSPSLAMSLAGIGYPLMLVLGAALLSRFRLQRLREAEAAARAEAERDRALAKSRIAAELHDSVGHDLTAIVALSEGLAGATGDEQLDRAIASINELARSGLADTRRAVRALAGEARSTAAPSALPGSAPTEKPAERHRWDEIAALLGSVRAAGVTAALTETGVRPDDPSQAGLAFRVCREGVTNALRHAAGLSRLGGPRRGWLCRRRNPRRWNPWRGDRGSGHRHGPLPPAQRGRGIGRNPLRRSGRRGRLVPQGASAVIGGGRRRGGGARWRRIAASRERPRPRASPS